MTSEVFTSLNDVFPCFSAWLVGVWDAVSGKRLTTLERLKEMSIFARLEALEASHNADAAVVTDLTTRMTTMESKPDVDADTAGMDALTARVATLESEVGTPPAVPAPIPAV